MSPAPSELENPLTVQELAIYPIKSCGKLAVDQFRIGAAGPEVSAGNAWIGDRQWMFVDRDGKFLTQRSLSQMALIQPHLQKNQKSHRNSPQDEFQLTLKIGSTDFVVPERDPQNRKTVSVWGKVIDAVSVSKEISQAASEFLKTTAELVFYDEHSEREALIKGKGLGVQTRFTDSQPYLIVTEESLRSLNSRLDKSVAADRFRANMVLSGASAPFAEDHWGHLGNPKLEFEATKPCARCKIITVDPGLGKISSSEPLKVLSQFRRQETQVYFGQYFLSRSFGEILKVGDRLSAAQRTG